MLGSAIWTGGTATSAAVAGVDDDVLVVVAAAENASTFSGNEDNDTARTAAPIRAEDGAKSLVMMQL